MVHKSLGTGRKETTETMTSLCPGEKSRSPVFRKFCAEIINSVVRITKRSQTSTQNETNLPFQVK